MTVSGILLYNLDINNISMSMGGPLNQDLPSPGGLNPILSHNLRARVELELSVGREWSVFAEENQKCIMWIGHDCDLDRRLCKGLGLTGTASRRAPPTTDRS